MRLNAAAPFFFFFFFLLFTFLEKSLCPPPTFRRRATPLNPEEIKFSYITCLFLVTGPFTRCHFFYLDLELWPAFEKLTFKQKEIGFSYCTCVFIFTRPFTLYHKFWPRDLDFELWHTFEKKKLHLWQSFQTRKRQSFRIRNVNSLWQNMNHY